jgi:methionyl-tRNA formyltransferase
MGTPDFAVPTLSEIVGCRHDVVAVYTRAPRPAGRGMELRPSPVEREARRFGIPVHAPATLRTAEAQETFRAHHADAAVVVAYGLILPKPILDAPRLGCFNLHASLLPRWRGAAPINRAIMAGDKETGVMVMKMEEGLDTGPIAATDRLRIEPDATAGELHDVLARRGAELMGKALGWLERGTLVPQTQEKDGVTYAHKLSNEETRIDWTRPAAEVHNHIRGLSSFPGAWFEMTDNGVRVRVKALRSTMARGSGVPGALLDDQFTVACGDGAVRILEAQRAGRQAMKTSDFLRGTKLTTGTRLV